MIDKIPIIDCVCKTKLINHHNIRDSILSEIDKNKDDELSVVDTYYSDRISKLDWYNATNTERPWVKIFLSDFCEDIKETISTLGYSGIDIQSVWYQQYLQGDTHGWHIHSGHFTGVYYLEYPKDCGRTVVCPPYSLEQQTLDTVEGDIVIFPAHWIHKAMPNNENRKTIISFNFNISGNLNLTKIK